MILKDDEFFPLIGYVGIDLVRRVSNRAIFLDIVDLDDH